jgi:ribosomal protein S6
MQMQRYEALVLTIPEITNDEAAELEKTIEKKLLEYKSKLVMYDRWGKYFLAYPVKKNEYGIYFLARFDIPDTKKEVVVKELKSLFDLKFNAVVMRYVICNIANDAPLTYKRPQSLDETPKDVDQFLKENKMSGLSARKPYHRSDEEPSEGQLKEEESIEADKQEQADQVDKEQ